MNQKTNTRIEDAAFKAVYIHQYNSNKAARYVCDQVPATSYELALETINRVVRKTPKIKGR